MKVMPGQMGAPEGMVPGQPVQRGLVQGQVHGQVQTQVQGLLQGQVQGQVPGEPEGAREPPAGPAVVLPCGWEDRQNANGQTFYVNHVAQTMQWQHPGLRAGGGGDQVQGQVHVQVQVLLQGLVESQVHSQVEAQLSQVQILVQAWVQGHVQDLLQGHQPTMSPNEQRRMVEELLFPLIQQVLPNRPFEVKKLITKMLLDRNVMNIADYMMGNKTIERSKVRFDPFVRRS
jgi:hypothetical protein